MNGRTIRVSALARVEGEGGIVIKVRGDKVVETKLCIFEPPRLFEAFLRGRHYTEIPDLVARICGICPVANQLTSCQAIENAFNVSVDSELRDLRRLLYCGEWISSHSLHMVFLHAPDFLGYEDAVGMSSAHPQVVQSALKIKKIGNDIVRTVGGRDVHPINVRVGGFYKLPTTVELDALIDDLQWARDAAIELIRWAAKLDIPEFRRDYNFVALSYPEIYPINEGQIVSSKGLNIGVEEYEQSFVEEQVPHSNALHSLYNGHHTYFCGPLARYHHHRLLLTQDCQAEAESAGLRSDTTNPFMSIVVRAVEALYAIEESLRLIERYEIPKRTHVEITSRAASGCSCSEAPRGVLYHRYRIGEDGLIVDARIAPPTAQSLRVMEQDLKEYVERNLSMSRERLTRRCEQVVRNYDPCLSCATHYLSVKIEAV